MRAAPPSSSHTSAVSWSPLPASILKVNYDGAVFRETNETGILAKELNHKSIILEEESEIIAQALQNEDQSFASYGHLIEEAQIYAEFFHSFRLFNFLQRGNFVAHNFARPTRYVSGLVVWVEKVPPHLNFVLLADYG